MATIDDLLRGAQLVRTIDAPPRAGLELEHLAAWNALARRARRALYAVPGAPSAADYAISDNLKRLESRGARALTAGGVEAEAGILSVALRLGAVADLLADHDLNGMVGRPSDGEHLRARVYGTLYRTAAYTVPAIAPHRAGWQDVLELAHLTKGYRDVRQEAGSPLEDLAAPSVRRQGVEDVVFRWERSASSAVLSSPTRLTLETVAADLAILSASCTVLGVALRGHMPGLEPHVEAMVAAGQQAHGVWTRLSRWPDLMTYPGARPSNLSEASLQLRGDVQRALRRGGRWASPEELLAASPPSALLDTVRRLAASNRRVSTDVTVAFDGLGRGGSRLWTPYHSTEPATGYVRRSPRWVDLDDAARESVASMRRDAAVALAASKDLVGRADEATRERAWRSRSVPAEGLGEWRSPATRLETDAALLGRRGAGLARGSRPFG